jgi:uncharacterized membrane protein
VLAILVVVGLQGHLMTKLLPYPGMSHRSLSIAVGGGIGFFLLLNVWEIVWPAQRRFIAWCTANPGQPPHRRLPSGSAALNSSPRQFLAHHPLLFHGRRQPLPVLHCEMI